VSRARLDRGLHGVLVHLTSVNAEIISINPHHPVTDHPSTSDLNFTGKETS